MKTSEAVAMLYLTSIAVVMSGDNIISARCKDFSLGVFDHLRINWIMYAANLFTVLYIVALAVNERKLEEEKKQNPVTFPTIESKRSNLDVSFEITETVKDGRSNVETRNDNCGDGSEISAASKGNNVEGKANLHPDADDLESDGSRQELISQIKDILLGEPKKTGLEEEQEVDGNSSFLSDPPLSPTEDIYVTPQQPECVVQRHVAIDDGEWSDSSYDVSMDDIISCKLQIIEELEESFLNSSGSLLHDATGNISGPPNREENNVDWKDVCKQEKQDQVLPVYTFSEPHNLLARIRDSNAQLMADDQSQQDNVQAAETSLTTENDTQKTKSSEADEHMQFGEEMPDSNVSHVSFADVNSMLSPGVSSFSQKDNAADSLKQIWSPTCESLLNTIFSVSSLEDFLSPEMRIPSPLVHNDQSLDGLESRTLGIRLHKPAGVKDMFLSIVSIDHDKGLDTVSETWTLGTREDMELVLTLDSNPGLPSSNKECYGRYSLFFNNKNELDSFLDAATSKESAGFSFSSSQDAKENTEEEKKSLQKASTPEEDCNRLDSFLDAGTSKERFGLSFLSGQDEKEHSEEECLEGASGSEEDFAKYWTSGFGRLVQEVASVGQADYNATCNGRALEDINLELLNEEKEETEETEEANFDESLSTAIAGKVRSQVHELLQRKPFFMHTAMAAGCVFLTCFVVYRCSK